MATQDGDIEEPIPQTQRPTDVWVDQHARKAPVFLAHALVLKVGDELIEVRGPHPLEPFDQITKT